MLEVLPEILEVTLFGGLTAVLSFAGTYIEAFAAWSAVHGQVALAAWITVIGLVSLFFAYSLFTDKFWPKYNTLRQRLRSTSS
jgi:hypothetical protein